jgi:RNA recognition motif-containing protein
METKLYVGNISQHVTAKEIKGLFSKIGKVISVDVIQDPKTKKSKGFAFVEMLNQGQAGQALDAYNGYTLGENPLKIYPVQRNEKLLKRRGRANLFDKR